MKSAPAVAVQRMVRRRWLYTVTDWDDREEYVDANGEEVCRDDAKEHIATDAEASEESDRRADLWETKQDALVASATRHSQGIWRESPNDACRVATPQALADLQSEVIISLKQTEKELRQKLTEAQAAIVAKDEALEIIRADIQEIKLEWFEQGGFETCAIKNIRRWSNEAVVSNCGQPILDRIKRLEDALERLSKLGNGDKLGNSDGNIIAQEALKQSRGEGK